MYSRMQRCMAYITITDNVYYDLDLVLVIRGNSTFVHCTMNHMYLRQYTITYIRELRALCRDSALVYDEEYKSYQDSAR